MRDSVVRLDPVVTRARIGVVSLVLLGCGSDAPAPSKIEDQLGRIEARLDRIDERLRSLERTAVVAKTLTVNLPKADAATPTLSRIAVTITSSQLFLNGEAVASIALRAQLEEIAATSPDASVVIQADESIEHGRVVEVMDTIKEAGFARIAIAARSEH